MLIEIACVLLVDRDGSVLLQLRDEHAPNWPGVWGMPGGHLEAGESPIEGAIRELYEETSLRVDRLALFDRQELPELNLVKSYFCGFTPAVQADVVVGEGAAIEFTRPADLLDGRPYTPGTEDVLRRFLVSDAYARLAAFTPIE